AWPADRLRVDGDVGYGLLRLPVVFVAAPAAMPTVSGGSLGGQGPVARAGLGLALGRLGIEVGGEAWPAVFGARYQGVPVSPRRFAARAAVAWGGLVAGGARWAAVVHAQLERTTADGDGVTIRQDAQDVGLGVRATWP